MRALTDDETRLVFEKLKKYIGQNLRQLVERPDGVHLFRLHKERVFYMSERVLKLAGHIPKKSLLSAGVCLGKFTHSRKFRLSVTALDYLARLAQYRVWLKPSGEQHWVYGNHAVTAAQMLSVTALLATAYSPNAAIGRPAVLRRAAVSMAAADQLKIYGAGVEVTEAMKEHAESKLAVPLDKFASILNEAQDIDLHLKVEKLGVHDEKHAGRTAHSAEVTVYLKGAHKTVTVSSQSEDMYSTIDDLESSLARQLRKAKERLKDAKEDRNRSSKNEMEGAVLEEIE